MNRRNFFTAAAGTTGYSLFIRVDALPQEEKKRSADEIRKELEQIARPSQPSSAPTEGNMTRVDLSCDVLVAGGGLAGVLAAVSAARHGAKVILVQDRSRLGGNSSSEVKMHVVGANNHKGRPGWREGGCWKNSVWRMPPATRNAVGSSGTCCSMTKWSANQILPCCWKRRFSLPKPRTG
jgi:hypothetical protein